MIRNRSTPQNPNAGGTSATVYDNKYLQHQPGVPYDSTPHYYPPPPPPPHGMYHGKGGGNGKMSVLILLVLCLCCIICLGVVGALAFAVSTGTLQIGLSDHAAEELRQAEQKLAAAAHLNLPEMDPVKRAQMKAEAREAAQQQHEREQQFVELAHKKAILQAAEANPDMKVDIHNIPPIAAVAMTPPKMKINGGLKGAKPGTKNNNAVKDGDGDAVTDDMLAKDIAAGHNVEIVEVEKEETDIAVGENRWDHAEHIPQWLKDYFRWHNEVTATLVKPNWRTQRYLVMTCLGGEVCGNVAHRLRPLMAMLRIAAESKRIFYIHWDLPDRLEKYLQPRQRGGISWQVPEFVMWKVRKSPQQDNIEVIRQQADQETRRVVNCMYNDDDFGESYYDSKLASGESSAQQAFHEVWDVLFKPTFMLEERLRESLHLMGLTPGGYAAVHIDYEDIPQSDAEREDLRLKVENAMNCMSNLRPGGPFLVAAQTYAIAREAIVYGKHHGVHIHAKQIAHDTSTVPTDLFTSFVEIMLMSDAKCVAFNRNGYGQLGYILGWDFNCKFQYTDNKCEWSALPGQEVQEVITA